MNTVSQLARSINRLIRRRNRFKSVFSTEDGKHVLADIYNFCGYSKQVHVPNDPYSTAYNAGMHRVIQHISSIMNQTDEDINKLTKLLNKGN